jgi:hypothetical protein
MGMAGMLKSPVPVETVVKVAPVLLFLTVMVAPGSAPPLESTTTPASDDVDVP